MKTQDYNELLKLIKFIEKNEYKLPFSELYHLVASVLDGATSLYLDINLPDEDESKLSSSNICYRSRIVKNINEIVSEDGLWAPPLGLNKGYGRCNVPDQQILYCSNDLRVNFEELEIEVGNFCVTARFCEKLNPENKKIFLVPIGQKRSTIEKNPEINPTGLPPLEMHYNEDGLRKLGLVEDFVLRSFKRKVQYTQNYKYKITAAISKFYSQEKIVPKVEIAGFIYPSIKSKYENAFNFAYYERHARERLEIVEIVARQILNISGESIKFDNLNYVAKFTGDGGLEWKV